MTPELEVFARRLQASGMQPLDALHLASASISKADYFCTCDDKLLKKARNIDGLNVSVVSPTELIMELDL
jgi:predicted nucleic acid-binding protein